MEKYKDILRHNSIDNLSNYSGSLHPEFYLLLTKHRDSHPRDESNFDAALKALGGESEDNGVMVIRVGHWGYGWLEHLLIREDSPMFKTAEEIENALADYPVVDDEHCSAVYQEHAQQFWSSIRSEDRLQYVKDNRDEFRWENFQHMLNSIRTGEDFSGDATRYVG